MYIVKKQYKPKGLDNSKNKTNLTIRAGKSWLTQFNPSREITDITIILRLIQQQSNQIDKRICLSRNRSALPKTFLKFKELDNEKNN